MIACDQAERISAELADLREQWNEDLQHWTNHRNANRSQRKDLTALRILEDLPGAPVLTITTASRIHGISRTAASRTLATQPLRYTTMLDSTLRRTGPGE